MKTIKVNWSQYHKEVQKLAEQIKKSGRDSNFNPCSHAGCMNHISHPCEKCGRQWDNNGRPLNVKYKAVYSPDNPMLAFLLSKELGIPVIENSFMLGMPFYYTFNDKIEPYLSTEVLIVSDIISTGKTREQYKDFDFVCLFQVYKIPSTLYLRTLVGKWLKINTKVIMPWEVE